MPDNRLTKQVAFITEIDRLKLVIRMTSLVGGSRHENTAEHSWHMAVMAMTLAEYADQPVDVLHALKMALIHDIVEIDAGDTFAFDQNGNLDKQEREMKAANRLFGLLPEDQAQEYMDLWLEFEEHLTPESHFAVAMDRMSPLFLNDANGGGTWLQHNIDADRVYERMQPIADFSQELWEYAQEVIEKHIKQGHIPETKEE